MPTLVWIVDSAEDRRSDDWREYAARFECPNCGEAFGLAQELHEHLRIRHPVAIPMLLLGREMATSETTVRRTLDPKLIHVVNTRTALLAVDGQPAREIASSALSFELSRQRDSVCSVELFNSRDGDGSAATSSFRIKFSIPDEKDLDRVDSEFQRQLSIEHPTMSMVDDFRTCIECPPAARDYASALADYVIGLAIKERHPDAGVHLDFDQYRQKFDSARGVLRDFNRPLPRAITDLIHFNLNFFDAAGSSACVPRHEVARGFFSSMIGGGGTVEVPPRGELSSRCPVDIVTDEIMGAAEKLADGRKPHPLLAEKLVALSNRSPMSEHDLLKVWALAAVAFDRLGDNQSAVKYLRKMEYKAPFDAWAQRKLQALE